ncbi:MAG: pyruvate formate-lyase-activating protein [Roseiflexaceae bacterium]
MELLDGPECRDVAVDTAALARGEQGFVHSYTTGSAVDGPGLRMVVWTTGCQMRCRYCHNPDTWHLKGGRLLSASELVGEVLRYRRFLAATGGGLTVSGGEPLVQAPFVSRVLRDCHAQGIHTALDTNGALGERLSDADLAAIDLVLLDIKAGRPATHQQVTGTPIEPVLAFARRLAALGRRFWVRFVLVPGLTDAPEELDALAELVRPLAGVERVEVLPFHQMGEFKWRRLGLDYPLRSTPAAEAQQVAWAAARLREHGVAVVG